MFGLSFGEILVLGVMALILIGPKQLPEVARNIGRFMNDLKRATEGLTADLKKQAKVEFDLNDRPAPPQVPPAARPVPSVENKEHPAASESAFAAPVAPAAEKKDEPS